MTGKRIRPSLFFAAALSIAFWNANAATAPAAEAAELADVSARPFDDAAVASGVTLASYAKVRLLSVEADLDQKRDEELSENEISGQTEELEERLTEALSDNFDIVSESGEGVLEISVTLTALRQSRPTLSDYSRQPGLSRESVYAGGAEADFVFTDGGSGETVATLSDRDFANGIADGFPRIGTWADAHRAFRKWARNLPDFIEEN
ncbi:MAG: DUF3313 family protein [Pseudomonadota bacterium]